MAFRVTVFIEVCLSFARSSDIDPIRIHICAGLVLVNLCKAAASCLLDLGATANGSARDRSSLSNPSGSPCEASVALAAFGIVRAGFARAVSVKLASLHALLADVDVTPRIR
jgi:hypothetical protein